MNTKYREAIVGYEKKNKESEKRGSEDLVQMVKREKMMLRSISDVSVDFGG